MRRPAALLVSSLMLVFASTIARGQDAQSRLWDAAISGDTVALVAAIDAGASLDSLDVRRNPDGRRALNWAAFNNRGAAVRILLARGASINAQNRTGFTPVHHAAEAGAAEALSILLVAGADINIPNSQGMLPIDTARERGHVDAVQLLEAAGKKP